MSESKKAPVEFRTSGVLAENGVLVSEQSNIDALSSRGYGTLENKVFSLMFYEAIYLLDKGMLEVKDQKGKPVHFQSLLQCYEVQNENAWVNYLVYRDLRSRGYVVREGFGGGIDFRIYERGTYGKDTAPYLIMITQEGKPLSVNNLADALSKCKSQKKELILAVMNRRGEVVHYSVSPLSFSKIEQEQDE
ncbi:MAG TPA: tRNA-intron lyase [Candidatus Binatia bacterium]|nr:tRNA-intron lyase [Candidatus Binatia bacterium]